MPSGSKPGERRGGRAVGTPNKANVATRARIESEADPIGFLIGVANGDQFEAADPLSGQKGPVFPTLQQRMHASDLLRKITTPECKERAITFAVGKIDSPDDALSAIGRVIEAMASAELTPSEAKAVGDVITLYQRSYEIVRLEERIAALEAATATGGAP